MFKRKEQPQPHYAVNEFRGELVALIDKAIRERIHLVDVRNSLDDQVQAVDFKWSQRAVI